MWCYALRALARRCVTTFFTTIRYSPGFQHFGIRELRTRLPAGHKRSLSDKWRLTSLSNKIITLATVVIAGAGVLTFGAAFFQWLEMRGAGTQTNKIIAADERIAGAMEEAIRQTNNALNTTVEQFRLDQRAWLGVTRYNSSTASGNESPYIEPDKEVRFIAQFTNSGKTPAKTTETDIAFQFLPKGVSPKPTFGQPNPSRTRSTLVVQPGATHFIQSLPTKFSAPQIEAARQQQLILYVYGRILYQDVFDKQHSTEFCAYIDPRLIAFESCASYNNAD
jgi:hypothetical protein